MTLVEKDRWPSETKEALHLVPRTDTQQILTFLELTWLEVLNYQTEKPYLLPETRLQTEKDSTMTILVHV